MRIFVNKTDIVQEKIIITGSNAHHAINVLRMKPGDNLTVCDGDGIDYLTIIDKATPTQIVTNIVEKHANTSEPQTKITLFQCIPKSGKIETIVQKSTELGVFSIVPVQSHRAIGRLDAKKISRLQKVAEEAAKQCGRGRIPIVTSIIDFAGAISRLCDMPYKFLPYEFEKTVKIGDALPKIQTNSDVGFIIGPEGGFTDEEVKLAEESGIPTITLGPRILRTETAASAVLPLILHLAGEI